MRLMSRSKKWRSLGIEMLIGLGLSGLVMVVSWASTGEVLFVYRGL